MHFHLGQIHIPNPLPYCNSHISIRAYVICGDHQMIHYSFLLSFTTLNPFCLPFLPRSLNTLVSIILNPSSGISRSLFRFIRATPRPISLNHSSRLYLSTKGAIPDPFHLFKSSDASCVEGEQLIEVPLLKSTPTLFSFDK